MLTGSIGLSVAVVADTAAAAEKTKSWPDFLRIEGAQVKYLGDDARLNGKEERQIEGSTPVAD